MSGDPMRRSDLKCDECGKVYEGPIDSKSCPACEGADPRPIGERVIDSSEQAAEAPKPDAPYRKVVRIDPDRERVDLSRRPAEGMGKARAKAMDAVSKEPERERERKEPLRRRIEELKALRESKREELAGIERDILELMVKLSPTEENEFTKKCFGRYAADDFECLSLCPLAVECRERTERGGVAERVVTAIEKPERAGR